MSAGTTPRVSIQTEDFRPVLGQSINQMRLCQQHGNICILHHESQAFHGVIRIQWNVCAT